MGKYLVEEAINLPEKTTGKFIRTVLMRSVMMRMNDVEDIFLQR
jgi:hypothetical protein